MTEPNAAKWGMRMTRFATLGLAIGLLAGSAAAPGALAATVGESCAVELHQLCGSQTGHALHQCRAANRGNFSGSCQQALAASGMKLKDVKSAGH
jgi:hypothetical protein